MRRPQQTAVGFADCCCILLQQETSTIRRKKKRLKERVELSRHEINIKRCSKIVWAQIRDHEDFHQNHFF